MRAGGEGGGGLGGGGDGKKDCAPCDRLSAAVAAGRWQECTGTRLPVVGDIVVAAAAARVVPSVSGPPVSAARRQFTSRH